MAVSAPLRWLGILLLALASLGCGLFDKLTDSADQTLTIQRFSASPVTIPPGSPTTLTWEVDGADTVAIDNGIGTVPVKGSRQVQPGSTTIYSMTAQAGTSQARATVEVQVQGSPAPSPSPSPTATPVATATPGPTPTPSSSPGAPPTPTPSPSPTAAPPACGAPAGNAGSCVVTIAKPNSLDGGCVEVNLVTVDKACPVAMTLPVLLRFDVTARTTRSTLGWRRAPANADIMEPGEGFLNGNASSTVVLTDVVLGDAAEIEILDGATVLLKLSVRH